MICTAQMQHVLRERATLLIKGVAPILLASQTKQNEYLRVPLISTFFNHFHSHKVMCLSDTVHVLAMHMYTK